jgi:hypothetical protein
MQQDAATEYYYTSAALKQPSLKATCYTGSADTEPSGSRPTESTTESNTPFLQKSMTQRNELTYSFVLWSKSTTGGNGMFPKQ